MGVHTCDYICVCVYVYVHMHVGRVESRAMYVYTCTLLKFNYPCFFKLKTNAASFSIVHENSLLYRTQVKCVLIDVLACASVCVCVCVCVCR